MTNMTTINWQLDNDGVALLTIDVPNVSMNVMTPEFLQDIATAAERIGSDEKVRGAVITSGKDSFMAGADLKGIVKTFGNKPAVKDVYEWCRGLQQALRKIETCGKPVAAAINGTALGGGLEVCLACHYRVASDNPKSKLGLPEVQVGLLPGGGGTQRLPRMIGIEPALQLITQGKHLGPHDALEAGIVNEVVKAGDEVAAAKRWVLEKGVAEQPWDQKGFKVPGGAGLMNPKAVQTFVFGSALMQKMTNHNYPAPVAIMSAVYEGTVLPIDKALDIETKYFVSLLMHPVSRNMIRTLFVNKGAADKLVRRPKEPAERKVTKLGILGAGMMGAGIAWVSAYAGMDVVLLDTTDEKADKGKDYSRQLAEKLKSRGKMSDDKADALLAKITTGTDFQLLSGCELVIEAVFEDRDIKADVTKRAEAVLDKDAIFASNTSTLPISGLAKASVRPQQFIGIHFFSPVDKMPLVEVILGKETSDIATAQALDYIRQIRKTPIVVNDSRGFYTSRVFSVYTREGMTMLAEGVSPALIENVARHAGMPVGPLAVTDEVSLELSFHVGEQTRKDLGKDYVASPADEVVRKFVQELDRKGKRFGKGFYEYPKDGKKFLWPGLAEHFPVAAEQPAADEVRKRLLYAQAIDTVRCLDENVVTHPADADIGSIFGWGFPPWTGGTLSFIETVGLPAFVREADRLAKTYGARFTVPDSLRKMAEAGLTFYDARGADSDRDAA
ncbi:MAG: 3-hydroxyacyl-CoA dehydrogenase NAD-binding domain-containing protein [Woeseia sp.]